MDLQKLSAPFPHDAVSWRIQGKPTERNGAWYGMALAYISARDVMDRLDDVCGPENWQSEFVETVKGRIICRLSIRINNEWVTKSDGAGDTDVEGEKGAISDALKRAAVSWGVARYLYSSKTPWVKCEVGQKNGNAYWRKWIDDPAKAARLALPDEEPAPQQQPKQDEKPKLTVDQAADQIIARINACPDIATLDKLLAEGSNTSKAWDRMAKERPDLAAKMSAAREAKIAQISQDETDRDRLDH